MLTALSRVSGQVEKQFFDETIAPILIDYCVDCHRGEEAEGGLDLISAKAVLKGGESGPAISPGNIDKSLLWQRIDADEMPPEDPLNDQQKNAIQRWIEQGAKWGTDPIDPLRVTTPNRAGLDWWAFQPLERPEIPSVYGSDWIRNPIDAFVLKRLQDSILAPSPQAKPNELLRRLSFDLTGLPPSPEEVRKFEHAMRDRDEQAYDELVTRLLDSKHFGERWGRHWLDVVRFGESQGFERDKLRDNSWHYRDWVIQALNDDLPYNEFVKQQLAGDVLYPDEPDAVTATGFLVAGPWDEVGQSQQSKAMKAVVRQDEIEDYVGTIGQTFLGLTINCARCHDHKFDPITQQEYYQLASAVGGVRHGSRNVTSEKDQQRLAEINRAIKDHQDGIAKLEATVRNRLIKERSGESANLPPRVSPISRWNFENDTNDQVGQAHATQHPKAKVFEGRLRLDGGTGYASTHKQDRALGEKTLEAWVRLDDLEQRGGGAISVHDTDGGFDAIVFGERQPGKWMAGSDFFRRTQDVDAPQEKQANDEFVHVAATYQADGTIALYRNGQPYGEPYKSSGPRQFRAGTWYVMFGLRTGGPASERQLRGLLETAQLYDRALTADEVRNSYECEKLAITHESILAALTPEERTSRDELVQSIESLNVERQQHLPHSTYAVVPKAADTAYVLARGNPASKGKVVSPGGVRALANVDADFGLAPDAEDAARRVKLAEWITHEDNALFARVIVNRLWHYHFGTGIVATPNDFGFSGDRPSHPQLLDWLAVELVESGWSLKHIHRLIVSSATYRQSSRSRPEAKAVDAENRFLWRKSPMRLEAEALRDAMLSVSGQLNRQYGGAPYRDFTTFVNNTQFYTMIDPDTPDAYRRTVYRTWIRSGRNHLLDAFDCPDPSTTAPKRAITTTPIQSLALMNNSFVLRMSERFASRVQKEVGDEPVAQIERVVELAYGRSAQASEIEQLATFVSSHGLAALCRVVFNSNEFVYVD